MKKGLVFHIEVPLTEEPGPSSPPEDTGPLVADREPFIEAAEGPAWLVESPEEEEDWRV